MTRKLPGHGDWPRLLRIARETALGTDPNDPVAHGRLVKTVGDECSTDNDTAERWIDTAVEKRFLDCRGSGLDREYVVAEGDTDLYDAAVVENYLDSDESTTDDITHALAATADYYHEQLTDEIRWMIDGKWGIDGETVERLKIGFAPKNNQLPAYLSEHDVTPTAALRAGVIRANVVKHAYECSPDECRHDLPDDLDELASARESGAIDAEDISLGAVVERAQEADCLKLYAWWDSRIVFPYRDEDGTIRYFIGRETGKTDDLPGSNKYLKLANSKPWVDTETVYEPIYGCETVEEGEPLLLTEGITDAIRAHESGFACVSPVTKAFKEEHHDELLGYAEQAGGSFLCFDSEKSGEGLKGALRTAWMLEDNGVSAVVAKLPREDSEEKIDVAEFLKSNNASALRELLADAITPEAHPAFDPTVHGNEDGNGERDDTNDKPTGDGPNKSGDNRSALYDLSIEDVIESDSRYGVSAGYRGDNPIQHVGDTHSEYFEYKKFKGEMRARDFKAEHSYTALTWLLCAADARATRSPDGSLSDEEHWEAWRYAKEQNILDDTDPLPWAASRHLARKHDLAPTELLRAAHDDPLVLPVTVRNRILALVEDEYGVNPGRDSRESTHKDEQRAEFLSADDGDDNGDGDDEREDKSGEIKRMLATVDTMSDED
jgi:hypothetical protein